ncbi:signal peptide peptidase SppA [Pseudocolwellia sp. AS88]|uniref:signal peptide peptidase SppA n=1 Tax=Pseudocolwellia sp. AS88 TaxID=3063958 RepID=UPI0026F0D457|nr:signal peptide peptidase SppA [Pseudocolwellia sp. AS88]MDO7086733.1 signal peptide peptidase SppA [Pseudocolwellia sp. AS88]
MGEKPNLFKRVLFGMFNAINVCRKIVINLLFFGLIIIFFVSISNDNEMIIVEKNSALILDISGDIVEQKKQVDPMQAFMNEALSNNDQPPEILLADILKVIESAASDKRISSLVLKLDRMGSAGLTKVNIIAQAIDKFKESGKPVTAIGENFTQDQYYLASYADEIWLDPNGWLVLDGYGRYQLYYKSAIEKLAITPHIFRVGTYKSAVEPYIRDDMSEQAKESNQLWLNDLWSKYKADVAEQRGFKMTNFDETADALVAKLEAVNGDLAKYALDNGWVDSLKTRNQVEQALNEMLGVDEGDDTYESVRFRDYLSLLNLDFPIHHTFSNNVAVVVAKGTILNGSQDPGIIGGDSTARLLRDAREDDSIKAVVLRVDSPGGSAFASEIIRQEVELLKQAGKPVVASMGTYAASGGYWISASADKIYAAPTTITGSIGIYGLMMTFENALSKLGVYTDGVGTTEFAGFTPTRPISNGIAQIIQMNVNKGYQDFITLVADNRNMTTTEVDSIAQGRVWSGAKAKELGLVDELGGLEDAIVSAAELADMEDYGTILIEKQLSPTDLFLKNVFGQASAFLPESVFELSPIEKAMAELKGELESLTYLNDPKNIYTLCMSCDVQ